MGDFISTKTAAARWNLSERQVSFLCKSGRIAGAKKPVDKRIKSGQYKKTEYSNKLPLPIGVSDYCLASTFGFTIDEVKEMARYYGASEKYSKIYEWYDGYRFGNKNNLQIWCGIQWKKR